MWNLKSPALLRTQSYINGAWVDADNGGTVDVLNPANGDVIASIANLGVDETRRAIEAADAAVKAANVELIDVHLAMAIGGKGYATLTGDVAAVTAAVEAAAERIKHKGVLVEKVVIPQPREEILRDKV